MVSGVLYDMKMAITRPSYMQTDKGVCVEVIKQKLPPIVAFMKDKNFLASANVSWLDFVFFEIVKFMEFLHPELYTDFPTLKDYHDRVAALDGLKEYLADPNCKENTYSFNNKHAKINNVDYS